ncbi:uncharacterized protein UTRI_10434_B [Ustilago trichophora]|uniref:Uncharacterized protein n=1 Tax=Ustilago trichophora TaxID=86804 RepID=A0A5C3ECT4_9BASI|nr:uncharacterized protein UTRI_10434_B [Ustilago trichophora]
MLVRADDPPLTGTDLKFWQEAKERYIGDSEGVDLRADGLQKFAEVADLNREALRHSEAHGTTPIGKKKAFLPRNRKPYFWSIVRPGHELHERMNLDADRAALALFRTTNEGTNLIHIDTVKNAAMDLPVWPLRDILRRLRR